MDEQQIRDANASESSNSRNNSIIRVKVRDLKRLQSVELPCFVQSEKSGYDLLGGEERVLSSLKTVTPSLQVQFPGSNPLSNGLQGRIVNNTPGLVIKVIRRKKKVATPTSSSSASNNPANENGLNISYNAEVVGVVNRSITFSDPADYQFLPSSLNVDDYRNFLMKPILEVVPQSFARVDYSKRTTFVNYAYDPRKPSITSSATGARKERKGKKDKDDHSSRENSEGEGEEDGEESEDDHEDEELLEKKRRKNVSVILKFGDKIPHQHPDGPHPPRWNNYKSDYRGLKLLERIRKVFNLIPVLTKQQLVDILGLGQKLHLFRECLQFAAYMYDNGPFLRLYVRYGYDPTKDPSAKMYQIITCRFQQEFIKEISDKAMNHVGREQCNGRRVDLDTMTMKEAPKEFYHSFIDKGLNARLPVSIFQCVLKHQVSIQLFHCLHPDTFDFVSKMKTLSLCNEQTGWFTAQSTEEFRKFVKQYIWKRIFEFAGLPEVTFDKSKDQIVDEEEVDKTISIMETFLSNGSVDESELTRVDDAIKWLKKYRDASLNANLYPASRSSASITLNSTTNKSSSSSSSAAPAPAPSLSAAAKPAPVSKAPPPLAGAAQRDAEVIQAAQGLTNLFDSKPFATLDESSDSEADNY